MIIEEEISIKVNNKNIGHYSKIISDIKYGERYTIRNTNLPTYSKFKVSIICDNCNDIINRSYCEYNRYLNDDNKYYCQKCNYINRSKTYIAKYGVSHFSKTDEYKIKVKKTCLDRYGFDNYAKTEENIERCKTNTFFNSVEFKEKSKKTKINKYDDENYNNILSIKNTKLLLYGNENYNNINKIKETCIVRYGVDNVSKYSDIKFKKTQTNLKNIGVEYPLQSTEIIQKIKSDNIEKIGVDWHSKTQEWKQLVKEIRIKNGSQIPDNKLSEFDMYIKKVIFITKKSRKNLLIIWDGYDNYDFEYIGDNFKLNSNDRCYPTVDHKLSLYYGFVNNIDPEIIGRLDNLCVTKRYINSSKSSKTSDEYLNKLIK